MNNVQNTTESPQLAAPGAGLPKHELLIGKLLFALKRRLSSREQSTRAFQKMQTEILQLVEQASAADGQKPVLIDRIRGIEDSSRYWSVFMTLHHLQIVNDSIAKCILLLVAGRSPQGETRIEDVKPDPSTDQSIVDTFRASSDRYLESVSKHESLSTKLKHDHPWFGPLDAAGWHMLASVHMGIHLEQIRHILRGL